MLSGAMLIMRPQTHQFLASRSLAATTASIRLFSLPATNFSSFPISAENFRIPSRRLLSRPSGPRFSRKRNVFSSRFSRY